MTVNELLRHELEFDPVLGPHGVVRHLERGSLANGAEELEQKVLDILGE